MSKDYKKTVAGTIGAGMKSVFAGDGKRYFVLEHKMSSAYHRAGEFQEIIVDQIELGRDSHCQVRFDDSEKFKTVSRRHAAIVRDGENWKLIQLSSTNKTLLNGVPVQNEWYLQNGDEIQLSVNGPKLGFIIPQGNKAFTKSIGLSRRLSLFRQQALRPYKAAMWILSILLVLAIGAGTYFIIEGNKSNEHLKSIMDSTAQRYTEDTAALNGEINRLRIDNKKFKQEIKSLKDKVIDTDNIVVDQNKIKGDSSIPQKISDNIYYIQTLGYVLELDGEQVTVECGDIIGTGEDAVKVDGWLGTAFLLSNGKLVTARHCVEGWYYDLLQASPWELKLNALASSGAKVSVILAAVSPKGDVLKFSSNDVMCKRSGDHPITLDNGVIITVAGNETFDNLDYAWFDTNLKGGLNFSKDLSNNLKTETPLKIYGYPHGWGMNGVENVKPIMGSGVVAQDGLENGVILVGSASFESGHSGSPVFYVDKDGKYTVVGIVSSKTQNYGFIVPISQIN